MTDLHVTAIYTYPIKSCAGLSHDSAPLEARGLRDDRRWMIVNRSGKFVTQRDLPRMALIRPLLVESVLRLTAPDMPDLDVPIRVDGDEVQTRRVVVWRSTCDAIDTGDAAAEWLSSFLGESLRLVKMADAFVRLTSDQYTDQPAPVGFADGYPLLLATDSSLADLNARLEGRDKSPLPMRRFRPNVVIGGNGAWDEDNWTRITIGGIPFDVVKPCARCVITTVDPATGVIPDHEEPLATLATFRRGRNGVLFGQNIIHRATGEIRVGDRVEVVERG